MRTLIYLAIVGISVGGVAGIDYSMNHQEPPECRRIYTAPAAEVSRESTWEPDISPMMELGHTHVDTSSLPSYDSFVKRYDRKSDARLRERLADLTLHSNDWAIEDVVRW